MELMCSGIVLDMTVRCTFMIEEYRDLDIHNLLVVDAKINIGAEAFSASTGQNLCYSCYPGSD